MKPKHAIKHLQLLVDTQKTISTGKLRKLVNLVASHTKMLESDNQNLRKKVRGQRSKLRRLEEENEVK